MSIHVVDQWFWRSIHSCFIDALEAQEMPNRIGIVVMTGGVGFPMFLDALQGDRLRVAPVPGDNEDGGFVAIEVFGDDGQWHLLTRIPPNCLGLDPQMLRDELDDMWQSAVKDMNEMLKEASE